jgi:hypothetical protein
MLGSPTQPIRLDDLCEAVYGQGQCEKRHRVAVLRALPWAMAQHPHLELVRYNQRDLSIRINYQRRPAWRRKLVAAGLW